MRTIAIIQARMGSTRLPGKVLRDLAGQPMIARVVHRVRRASLLDEVVVATTTLDEDRSIAEWALSHGVAHVRGNALDVLDRYHQAASAYEGDCIVRITADCPLIDPSVIDRAVGAFAAAQPEVDYLSNVLPTRTYPRGLDVEVFHRRALEQAWREDRDPAWREHVTPYLYRHPELFRIHGITSETDYSDMRWTVDTPEDYQFALRVYEWFGHDKFSWLEVLAVLREHPDWSDANRHVAQKAI